MFNISHSPVTGHWYVLDTMGNAIASFFRRSDAAMFAWGRNVALKYNLRP
jgi:hypothetical protein